MLSRNWSKILPDHPCLFMVSQLSIIVQTGVRGKVDLSWRVHDLQKFLMVRTNAMMINGTATIRLPQMKYRCCFDSLMEGYKIVPIKIPIVQPCELSINRRTTLGHASGLMKVKGSGHTPR